MLPGVRRIEEYVDRAGSSPFRRWFEGLEAKARSKVAIAIERVEQGGDGSIKSVGNGVCEIRIDWGPGYRIYCGFDGRTLVILLGGGTKRRQSRDIAEAKACWLDYKGRKERERR